MVTLVCSVGTTALVHGWFVRVPWGTPNRCRPGLKHVYEERARNPILTRALVLDKTQRTSLSNSSLRCELFPKTNGTSISNREASRRETSRKDKEKERKEWRVMGEWRDDAMP